jgi:hypothetical protein
MSLSNYCLFVLLFIPPTLSFGSFLVPRFGRFKPTFQLKSIQKLHRSPRQTFMSAEPFYGVGFDFGTSGARLNVVNSADLSVVHSDEIKYSEQKANIWLDALNELLSAVPPNLRQRTERIAVSGTSASVLTIDAGTGAVTRGPRMYDFSAATAPCGDEAMRIIAAHAPAGHTVRSSTSTLPKVLPIHLDDNSEKQTRNDIPSCFNRSSAEQHLSVGCAFSPAGAGLAPRIAAPRRRARLPPGRLPRHGAPRPRRGPLHRLEQRPQARASLPSPLLSLAWMWSNGVICGSSPVRFGRIWSI